MTTENDPDLFQDQSELAGKYPDNTTIVYMDKINTSASLTLTLVLPTLFFRNSGRSLST
jgi:hypothetical protein